MTATGSPRKPSFFGWPPLHWDVWLVLSVLFLATAIVSAVGEYLGWWEAFGDVLAVVSLALGLWTFGISATRAAVRTVDEKLDQGLDRLDTLGVVLVRIERLLDERLPPAQRS